MHVHVAVGGICIRGGEVPFIPPSPSFSLSSVHLRPISLIGAPSFLDGDPCMCMSPSLYIIVFGTLVGRFLTYARLIVSVIEVLDITLPLQRAAISGHCSAR